MKKLDSSKSPILRNARSIVHVFIVSMLLTSLALPRIRSEPNLEDIALEYVSRTYNVPIDRLVIVNSGFLRLESKKRLWETKIFDSVSGEMFGVALNEAGQVVDRDLIVNEDRIRQNQLYGKLEKGLYTKLTQTEDDEIVTVAIWVNDGGQSIPRPSDESQLSATLNEISEMIETLEAPMIEYLQSKGCRILYASKYAPLVFANLSKTEILRLGSGSLSDSLGVSKMFLTRNDYMLMVNSLTHNILAQYVWQRGITGNYDPNTPYVAVVEDDKVSSSNGYIPLAISYNAIGYEGFHATMVAGVVAGQLWEGYEITNDFRGVAPGAKIVSANIGSWTESDIVAAVDWAISQGARITVNSFGAPPTYFTSSLVSYYDYLAWGTWTTNVVSAGNQPNWGTYEVLIPGVAHNVITVGSYGDKNTPEWGDDQWSWFSCYLDHYTPFQIHGDYNKPEVSSIGESVLSTDLVDSDHPNDYGGELAGTSFSAPAVAGVAALLMHRQPILKLWPEPLKAILMVSTWHPRLSNSNESAAGEVLASMADDVADRRLGDWSGWTLNETQFGSDFTLGTFYLTKGERAKVALVWDSHSTGYGQPDVLASDLDLRIRLPNGSYSFESASFDNCYEYTDFVAPLTGTYTAIAHKYRWDPGNQFEYIGYAFSRQPSSIDYVGRDVVASNAYDVYCILPDLGHAAATDWSGLGVVYGMMANEQNIGLDSWSTWIDQTIGRPILPTGKTLLTVGSSWVNYAVRYYENRSYSNFWNPGTTPVCDIAYVVMKIDGVGDSNHIWFQTTSRSSIPNTILDNSLLHIGDIRSGTVDMFVIQSFTDGDNREVMMTYGFGWRGSWIATQWLKNQFSEGSYFPSLAYHWVVVKWTDGNGDKLPQLNELEIIYTGDC